MRPDAPIVWMPGGIRTEIHLDGDQTGGAFCLLLDQPPAGWALPAHRHQNEAETIHILEGEFEMEVEVARSRMASCNTNQFPRGVMHLRGKNCPRIALW